MKMVKMAPALKDMCKMISFFLTVAKPGKQVDFLIIMKFVWKKA